MTRALLLFSVFLFLSFPLAFSLFRNYQWERSQAPTAIVPDLIGLPLQTGTERAHSLHLETKVLGSTWYTNLSPGRITLQSPEPGQRVTYHTAIGVEVATAPPVLAPVSPQFKNDSPSGNRRCKSQPTAVNSYTYTLNVANNGGSTQQTSKTTTVLVTSTPTSPACPNVQSFDGDSCIVAGNSATLRWNVGNADFVDVTGPGVSRTFSANPVGTGSFTVTPAADTTCTLTARTNATGPQAVARQAIVGATPNLGGSGFAVHRVQCLD